MQTASEGFANWAKMALLAGCVGIPLIVGVVAAIALLAKGSKNNERR